jgi:DNA mismatch repair protein MutS2
VIEAVSTMENRDGVQAPEGAGTPSSLSAGLKNATGEFAALELDRVLDHVAGHARGPLGADRVRARRPSADEFWIRTELEPVAELLAFWERGESVDVPPVPELGSVLGRLRVQGSVLSGPDLLAIRQTLAAARIAAAELRRVAADAPRAAALVAPLPDRSLDQRLAQAIGDDGEVLDTASPALLQARREIHASRERLVRKLESVMRGVDAQALPQGAQVTIRGDRYVIPVRRDSRSRPEGIVHDESASHGTLFVEPTAAIEFGNAFRSAVVQAEREVLKVLRELSERARPEVETIAAAHAMCVAGDDLVARVRYAHACGASVPAIGGDALVLVRGRHPLLLARGIDVIPFDLSLDAAERTLLISGPNAGGKTVLIKTVGLAVLLAQAGIVPPVGPGTRLPVFAEVFADIGDHQSIAADLSTFSAHVMTLRTILDRAGADTLVLMDEVGSGTDPAEGAALARAALRALTARGARTIATSHLGSLKTLAGEASGVINGSLDFDAAALRPTFRFTKGVPGRSYGLAIAKRLGVDPSVVERAEREVPSQERALDELLAQVEERARVLAAREAELAERLIDVDRREAVARVTEESQSARARELDRRERDAERQGRREARRHLLDARATVEEALRRAQGAAEEAQAREARRILEQAAQAEGEALTRLDEADRPAPTGAPLEVGRRVRLASGGTGTVVELRGDGKIGVALGAMKVVVPPAELTVLPGKPKSEPAPIPRGDTVDPTAPFEIDLRGLRGDEAEMATLAALDAAVLAENPYLRIIHGMGTGVVRETVRRVLKADRRVSRFDFAPRHQGGTGVTIAELGAAS